MNKRPRRSHEKQTSLSNVTLLNSGCLKVAINSPLKRECPSFEPTRIPFTQDALCQICLEIVQLYFKSRHAFSLYHDYYPLGKGSGPLHSLHLRMLSHVWLTLAEWFWRIFLNIVKTFSLFNYYLPLEKDMAVYLNKLKSPLSKDATCPVVLE